MKLRELLEDAVDAWPEFDSDEEVNGADLVDWFAPWRVRVKEALAAEPAPDDEDETYPLSDWRYEVANGDTLRGYAEWVRACRERDHA